MSDLDKLLPTPSEYEMAARMYRLRAEDAARRQGWKLSPNEHPAEWLEKRLIEHCRERLWERFGEEKVRAERVTRQLVRERACRRALDRIVCHPAGVGCPGCGRQTGPCTCRATVALAESAKLDGEGT